MTRLFRRHGEVSQQQQQQRGSIDLDLGKPSTSKIHAVQNQLCYRRNWFFLISLVGLIYYKTLLTAVNKQGTSSSFSIEMKEQEQLAAVPIRNDAVSIDKLHNLLCNDNSPSIKNDTSPEWELLCSENFVKEAAQILLSGGEINLVQIGAHVGFEPNDPIAKKITTILNEVDAIHRISSPSTVNTTSNHNETIRNHFHWTFVEPSPPNFKRLVQNLAQKSDICDMKAINAAVVSDSTKDTSNMIFYSIRDTIDPETGYDSLSGKTLPKFITQVSSFSREPILHNRRVFRKIKLSVHDYIVETPVDAKTFSNLMQEVIVPVGKATKSEPPFMVLIDTEGFDCSIVEGISHSSSFLPKYLIYESKQCKFEDTNKYLKSLGYDTFEAPENVLAVKKRAPDTI